VRRLIAEPVLVRNARQERGLPAQVDRAVAHALQHEGHGEDGQRRCPHVHQRHDSDHEHAQRRRAEAAAPIEVLAEHEVRQQSAPGADQLEHADIGVARLEAVDQDQCIERRSHE
jgi:hypothetical protein